jgi:hypothetical protein
MDSQRQGGGVLQGAVLALVSVAIGTVCGIVVQWMGPGLWHPWANITFVVGLVLAFALVARARTRYERAAGYLLIVTSMEGAVMQWIGPGQHPRWPWAVVGVFAILSILATSLGGRTDTASDARALIGPASEARQRSKPMRTWRLRHQVRLGERLAVLLRTQPGRTGRSTWSYPETVSDFGSRQSSVPAARRSSSPSGWPLRASAPALTVVSLVLLGAGTILLMAEPDVPLRVVGGDPPVAMRIAGTNPFGLRPEAAFITWRLDAGASITSAVRPRSVHFPVTDSLHGDLSIDEECIDARVVWSLVLDDQVLDAGTLVVGSVRTLDDVATTGYGSQDHLTLTATRADESACVAVLHWDYAGFDTPGQGPMRP